MLNLRGSLAQERESLEQNIKRNTPVKTGNLRKSVTTTVDVIGTEINLNILTLDYGKYVNYRTHFLDNEVTDQKLSAMGDDIVNQIADSIEDELNKLIN